MMRVNEAVREVLSSAVASRLKDPRIGFVTITGVEVTSDLRHAKVYYSVLGSRFEKEETLNALRASGGFLRAEINRELNLKRSPELEFAYDESIDAGMRINMMIRAQERALGIDADVDELPDDEGSIDPTQR
ncbi:MAG: 30S ribosome-binding factor RbfA [Actinobacteria bacterium]|nr:30S ribosome-binding factor RbfA [Actinomycetota bacterium]